MYDSTINAIQFPFDVTKSSLLSLKALRVRFTLETLSPICMGYLPGSTIFGALKSLLRPRVCITGKPTCKDCPVIAQCHYGTFFESRGNTIKGYKKGFEHAPRPFILHFPHSNSIGTIVKAGTQLVFDLILLGNAVEVFPALYAAFRRIEYNGLGADRKQGEFGRVRIVSVEKVEKGITESILDPESLLKTEKLVQKDLGYLISFPNSNSTNCILKFQTPLRISYLNKWVGTSQFEFHHLIRALTRRIDTLLRFYGKAEGLEGASELVEKSNAVKVARRRLKWYMVNRYSNQQKQKHPADGLMGEIELEGDLGTFMPLLKVGEWIHAGKNTTMGMGQYRVYT